MINVATAVKYNGSDTLLKGSLCESCTNLASCFLVRADALEGCLVGVCANERYAVNIVDDLSRDVSVGAIYSETRSLGSTGDLAAYSLMSLKTLSVTVNSLNHFLYLLSLLTGLSGLTADSLTGVLNTLTKVGLGRSLGSDNCSNLTYSLLVNTLNDDGSAVGALELDTVLLLADNGVGVTETEDDLRALLLYSVTYTYDLELLL